ncbi:MAG TPA: RnfABCDGE type electron transport complex subunit D [Desulfomicrobiaceae bacterium]|nr:RnfABCDGE type electron transport complex subunit D [Desulfomicrobiaceae bacterium]
MTPQVIKPYSQVTTRLIVSPPSHWRSGRTIKGMMQDHLIALLPAVLMAMASFGFEAFRVLALAGATAVVVEALCLKLMNRDITVDNYSALFTGIAFAFLLPPTAPWWLVVIGSSVAIILGRIVFGGLGANPLCAPLVAWAVCRLSWPAPMDMDLNLLHTTLNYPLTQLKYFGTSALYQFDYSDLLLGNQIGGLGTSQVIALLAGGVYLLVRKQVRWHIPAAFIGSVFVTAWIFHLSDPTLYAAPLFHVLAGGVVFGAFFLAADPACSPVGRVPMLLFGAIAGIMVVIIRVYGVYPDGVPFAILLANLLSPLLDRVRPKPFGAK